jgi:molybdate transport system regulatory protein
VVTGTSGRGRAALVEDGVEFDSRDATLLRTIHRTESIATATSELGRSRARALRRIDDLEEAFGDLVERQRGGSGGGGSRLTENGRRVLDRYDRLAAVISATAQIPETVLRGEVLATDGELATVETDVGRVRGIHDGIGVGDAVQVRIGADAITVHEPETVPASDATSARNRLRASVTRIGEGETVLEVVLDVDGTEFRTLVTDESRRRLGLEAGAAVGITWKATATRLAPEIRE